MLRCILHKINLERKRDTSNLNAVDVHVIATTVARQLKILSENAGPRFCTLRLSYDKLLDGTFSKAAPPDIEDT